MRKYTGTWARRAITGLAFTAAILSMVVPGSVFAESTAPVPVVPAHLPVAAPGAASAPVVAPASASSSPVPNPPPGVTFGSSPAVAASEWANVTTTPTTGPAPRYGAAMAYDGKDGYSVLFGGVPIGKGYYYNDTWEWKSGAWVNVTKVVSGKIVGAPPGLAFADLAYDTALSELILFGGVVRGSGSASTTGAYTNYTWAFSGGTWTNLTSSAGAAPEPRFDSTMAYDIASNEMVLFGGAVGDAPTAASAKAIQRTWVFSSSGVWSNISSSLSVQPTARDEASMAYDAAEKEVVLFGGTGPKDRILNDTWIFRGGKWENITSWSKIQPDGSTFGDEEGLRGAQMVYDASEQTLVLWGGQDIAGQSLTSIDDMSNETYIFGSQNWTNVTPMVGYPAWFNGTFMGAADYDNASNVCLFDTGELFFNPFQTGSSNFTWDFQWSNISVTLSDNRTNSEVPINEEVIFNATVHGGTWSYSFSYTKLPPGCSSQNVSELDCVPTSTGIYNVTVAVTDADGVMGTALVEITVFEKLTPTLAIDPDDIDEGSVVYFNTSIVGGAATGGHTYSFAGMPSGCSSTDAASFSCTPKTNGSFDVVETVEDSVHDIATTNGTLTIHPKMAVTLTRSASEIEGLQTLYLNATASGGDPAYGFAWTDLPSGCTSSDVASLVCVPLAADDGTFTPTVTLSDQTATTKNASVTVRVWPELTAQTTVTPLAAHEPFTVSFSSIVSGGDPPYLVTWLLFGSYQEHANATFDFTTAITPGNYTFLYWANDSLTGSVTASATVDVEAPIPGMNASIAVDPSSMKADVGEPVTFTASATGGLPGPSGYSYFWSPVSGCTAAGSVFSCLPEVAGFIYATAIINDSVNDSRTVNAQVSVSPRLGVSASETSSSATCGPETVNLTASPSGGTRPYSFAWTFPGGATANGTTVSHYFATPANYSVGVVVTDGTGTVNASVTYVVIGTCSSTMSSSALSPLDDIGLAVVVIVIVALVLAVVMRRRGGGEDEAAAPPEPEPPAAPPSEDGEYIYGSDRPISGDSFAVGPQESWPPGEAPEGPGGPSP